MDLSGDLSASDWAALTIWERRMQSPAARDQEDPFRLAYCYAHRKLNYPLERLPSPQLFVVLAGIAEMVGTEKSMRAINERLRRDLVAAIAQAESPKKNTRRRGMRRRDDDSEG